MSAKKMKPRKKDHKVRVDIVVRDGNERILEFKDKNPSALQEVMELIKRKL